MKITRITDPNDTPSKVQFHPDPDDVASRMTPSDVETVCEIFETPLVGSYNWDYRVPDSRIRKLYELGKKLNWNVELDIDWDDAYPKDQFPDKEEFNTFAGFKPYEDLPYEKKLEFNWKKHAAGLSDFLHGEQGALLVASQLVSCAPTYDAKLYASSQTFDEARHVEFFNKYLQNVCGITYPISKGLKSLLDKILTDERWDLKFIGMQVIVEGLALAAFQTTGAQTAVPQLQKASHYILRDEARHFTFGVNYLEDYVSTLSQSEKDERGLFAFDALMGMFKTRTSSKGVLKEMGWDKEAVKAHMGTNMGDQLPQQAKDFMTSLMGRVLPSLNRIGLLTDKVKPMFDQFGLLEFADLDEDSSINWSELEAPLQYDEKAWTATS